MTTGTLQSKAATTAVVNIINVTNGRAGMTRACMTETAFVNIINVTNSMAG